MNIGLMALANFFVTSTALVQGTVLRQKVRFSTIANKVRVIKSLPVGKSGVEIVARPEFTTRVRNREKSFVTLELTDEPIWVIEGNLPQTKNLKPELSPFGFHPASADEVGYDYANEIGVVWDRAGLYLMWVLGQRDTEKEEYNWKMFDQYFKKLPDGMKTLKNITVAHDGMVRRPARTGARFVRRRPVDISQHLEGTTYRPKDVKAYQSWVGAVVERYDGDGKDDMPGLRVPVKYWQVDNEPPRGREGYADLVRITSEAIKQAYPGAKVLIGGLMQLPYGRMGIQAYEKAFLPILRELEGTSIDIFDMHWFGHIGEWKVFPEVVLRVRQDLQTCGFKDIPIWITEMGTYSGKPFGRAFTEQSEREQASEMVKRYVVALGEGVEKIFWAWGMIEGFGDPEDNDFFDNTGFVYDGIGPRDPGRGTKKIAYWTYQKMTQLLQYWDGSQPQKINIGKDVVAYRFRFSKDGKLGIVAEWRDCKHISYDLK